MLHDPPPIFPLYKEESVSHFEGCVEGFRVRVLREFRGLFRRQQSCEPIPSHGFDSASFERVWGFKCYRFRV